MSEAGKLLKLRHAAEQHLTICRRRPIKRRMNDCKPWQKQICQLNI